MARPLQNRPHIPVPPLRAWPLIVLGLWGCLPAWPDSGAAIETGALAQEDKDRDGATVYVDCDDGDPTIHPGATEICDGIDQDCDGLVDDGAEDERLWFADVDRDGWGNTKATRRACVEPPGHVGQGGDCDDLDNDRSPVAPEACNGRDDDCDGVIDEDC